MKYIDLYLQKIDEQKRYTLAEIIEKFRISVILGHPGSGKSSLLSKYQEENNASAKNIKKLSLKEFIRFGLQNQDDIDILLLDGIDEYRIATNDTTFVMEELGHKFNGVLGENKSLRVVLTCRELDWYGEDQDKLKDKINADVELFYLLPLNQEQQEQLASLLEIKESDTFLAKFEKHGFLMNPQMFFMLSEIWKDSKEEISSKGDLYKKFIKLCVEENNPTHKANEESKDRTLESEQALKLIGYLSYFYFFCGQEEFSEKLIKEIADEENGYSIGKIKQILKTKAFLGDCFIHKTIAEFALAYHIVFFKTSNALSIDEKIKSLFVRDNDKIPTKLRGAYAWICSLSEDLSLIEIDPYYQAIHADNSMFDIQRKQAVLEAVRLYSNKNPYFLSFSHKLDLGGFYTRKLDQALIDEYTEAIRLNNHYVYFLNNILAQGKPDLSEEMFSFLENILLDDEISHYYKEDLISCFDSNESQKGFLLELLNKIKDGALKDPENLLKDLILTILYPDFLSPKDILPYLISYERTDIIRGHCFYLFKTKYSDKRALVDEILQNQKLLIDGHNSIVFGVRDFINDFFLEVLLTYDETLECAEKIYECIQYFYKTYHMHYQTMFKAFGEKRKKEEKESQEKLQKLSNELFRIRLEKFLEKEDIDLSAMSLCLYDFPYYCDPTHKKDICFSKMNHCYPTEKNRFLFFAGLNCVPHNKRNQEEYRQKAKEYQIEKDYEEYLKPPKEFEEWQMKAKEEELEQKKKEEENKKSNEEYFRFKKDEEILSDFKALSWISDLCFSEVSVREKRISQETFERLENVLKNVIYQKNLLASEHLTLQEMAKRPQNSIREIDTIYYTALCINEEREGSIKIQQIDKDFREYLYLVALWYEGMYGVKSSSFCSVMEREQKEETRNILRRYINALMSIFCQSDIIEQCIQNEQDIQTLKMLANTHEAPSNLFDSFIQNFLVLYGFQLESDLKEILLLPIGQNNKITINALLSFFGKSGDYSIKNALALYSLFQSFGRARKDLEHCKRA